MDTRRRISTWFEALEAFPRAGDQGLGNANYGTVAARWLSYPAGRW